MPEKVPESSLIYDEIDPESHGMLAISPEELKIYQEALRIRLELEKQHPNPGSIRDLIREWRRRWADTEKNECAKILEQMMNNKISYDNWIDLTRVILNPPTLLNASRLPFAMRALWEAHPVNGSPTDVLSAYVARHQAAHGNNALKV